MFDDFTKLKTSLKWQFQLYLSIWKKPDCTTIYSLVQLFFTRWKAQNPPRLWKCFTVYWMLILDQKAVDCKLRTRLDILQPYHITLQRIRLSHDIKKFDQGNIHEPMYFTKQYFWSSLANLISFSITHQYIYICI